MNWNMVTDSEVVHLSVPQRFFEYAQAYRNAASTLCIAMTSDKASCTWPNATVVLLLAAHATELFIKGAVFSKEPSAKIEHHRLDELNAKYRQCFPEPAFEWDIPFTNEFADMGDAEIEKLQKTMPIPVPSMLYRYPVAQGGKRWNGVFGFEPNSFRLVLDQLERDFERIRRQLA